MASFANVGMSSETQENTNLTKSTDGESQIPSASTEADDKATEMKNLKKIVGYGTIMSFAPLTAWLFKITIMVHQRQLTMLPAAKNKLTMVLWIVALILLCVFIILLFINILVNYIITKLTNWLGLLKYLVYFLVAFSTVVFCTGVIKV